MILSILIVTYNSESFIADCLKSIYDSQTDYTYEVIVVDNHSTDNTASIISEFTKPIKTIYNQKNEGFGFAMNQGFGISEGKYIILFNPDTLLNIDSIQNAINFMKANPQIGLIGPTVKENNKIQYSRHQFNYFRKSLLVNYFNKSKTLKPENPDYIEGTGLVVSRLALDANATKIIDSEAFLFWEELILAKKIKANGFKLAYCENYQFTHFESTSFKTNYQKLYVARQLSLVYENRIRKESFGILNPIINNLISFFENFVFYLWLFLKNKKRDELYQTQLLEYKIACKILICNLYTPKSKFENINNEAKLFFNNYGIITRSKNVFLKF